MTANAKYRVLGITEERTVCECCGKSGLKCTVALDIVDAEGNVTGEVVYFGRDCASKALLGNNKRGNVKSVDQLARGIEYARKWLFKTPEHKAKLVANAINVRFCPCWDRGDTILFENGVIVKV